ncbi:10511_t:CDS:2, partial [Dentiscutata erythropus]
NRTSLLDYWTVPIVTASRYRLDRSSAQVPIGIVVKEPTITEVQEELPKENILVTKKNDETDDKLKSLYIQEEVENQLSLNKAPRDELTMEDQARTFALQKSDTNEKENTPPNINDEGFITPFESIWTDKTAILAGRRDLKLQNPQTSHEGRVITADILYKKHLFKITNVYASPNMKDMTTFFKNWIPSFDEDKINIIAGDFNTNLDPTINRISQANAQNDSSRLKLKRLLNNFLDSASLLEKKPFLTFYQNTRNNQSMAICLDYIFIDENYDFLTETQTTY